MLLVKYGEIALKSQSVRRRFEQQLEHNIEKSLIAQRIEASMKVYRGVLVIHTEKTEEVGEILARTFGVVYYSHTSEIPSEQEDMEKEARKLTEHYKEGATFVVRAKRTGSHSFTSMELAARLGEVVLEAYPEKKLKVNLRTPQNTLTVEVRDNKCHMYTERRRGPGGMPVGSQGRALLVVPKGKEEEAAVAGWLVLKRGVRLFIHVEKGAKDVTPLLRPWGGPERPADGEEPVDSLYKTKSIAMVFPDRDPREKPPIDPPLAVLYPIAGFPENMYKDIHRHFQFVPK